jgi:Ser/Thr protein kinase RdoA (MazF antagonist)
MPKKLNSEILAAAIEGFEAQRKRTDAQIAEIRQLMTGGSAESAAKPVPVHKRRKMSAAARKRIAEAQRKRWAESKKESGATPQGARAEAQKPKRRLNTSAGVLK